MHLDVEVQRVNSGKFYVDYTRQEVSGRPTYAQERNLCIVGKKLALIPTSLIFLLQSLTESYFSRLVLLLLSLENPTVLFCSVNHVAKIHYLKTSLLLCPCNCHTFRKRLQEARSMQIWSSCVYMWLNLHGKFGRSKDSQGAVVQPILTSGERPP